MARGAEGKLRRRNRKEEEKATANSFFADAGGLGAATGSHDFGPADIPMPPGMSEANVEEDDSADEAPAENETAEDENDMLVPKKKKKKSKKKKMNDCCDKDLPRTPQPKGIKSTPLILLIIMTGSTLLPALIFASDYLGNFMQRNHVLGQVGFRLGMGSVPRKRVLSFYEKHDPSKLEDVPKILSKHYGDYPLLVKKLERKYHDYGYFLGWEEDEAPITLAKETLQETYDIWIQQYWNRYAPQPLKTAARNVRYNLTFLQKRLRKVWKKTVWPILEPIFGVPDGAAAQKRKDAAEARKRKQEASRTSGGGGGGRRRNTDFRDDED